MRVLRASAMGPCPGVRRALGLVDRIRRPDRVTIHGDLVHNEIVQAELDRRGFRRMSERTRGRSIPETPAVLVTAHGLSEREQMRLRAAGKRILDTTCPLVRHVQKTAARLEAEGRLVLVIGRPGHVEVEGIVGDLERSEVVDSAAAVRGYDAARLGVVCQSTTRPGDAVRILRRIREANSDADVRAVDTICAPTRRRQAAVDALVRRVEAVVVVGGRHSNNTRQLARRVEVHGLRAFHVCGASDLVPDDLAGIERIGVTAGTSTLPATVDAVCRALERWPGTVRRLRSPPILF